MIKLYCKKRIPTEVVEWTGRNEEEILKFCKDAFFEDTVLNGKNLYISTLEGNHFAKVGSMIAKGVKGECWPIDREVFNLTYEEYR
jgi:hypothetical protein